MSKLRSALSDSGEETDEDDVFPIVRRPSKSTSSNYDKGNDYEKRCNLVFYHIFSIFIAGALVIMCYLLRDGNYKKADRNELDQLFYPFKVPKESYPARTEAFLSDYGIYYQEKKNTSPGSAGKDVVFTCVQKNNQPFIKSLHIYNNFNPKKKSAMKTKPIYLKRMLFEVYLLYLRDPSKKIFRNLSIMRRYRQSVVLKKEGLKSACEHSIRRFKFISPCGVFAKISRFVYEGLGGTVSKILLAIGSIHSCVSTLPLSLCHLPRFGLYFTIYLFRYVMLHKIVAQYLCQKPLKFVLNLLHKSMGIRTDHLLTNFSEPSDSIMWSLTTLLICITEWKVIVSQESTPALVRLVHLLSKLSLAILIIGTYLTITITSCFFQSPLDNFSGFIFGSFGSFGIFWGILKMFGHKTVSRIGIQ